MGRCFEYFAGGNSSEGFHSFSSYILPQYKAEKIICIKGGPGTGKSTLMKMAARKYWDTYDVELFHCSSDPDSLDGVVVPELKLAIIDGTAPHVIDPIHPAAVDTIFNAGEFWDEAGIKAHRDDIVSLCGDISEGYREIYFNLKLVGEIEAHEKEVKKEAENGNGVNVELEKLFVSMPECKNGLAKTAGKVRKLFLNAITPKGLIDFSHQMEQLCQNVYLIRENKSSAGSRLIAGLDEILRACGYDTMVFYSPFCPNGDPIHLYIEKTDTFITVSSEITVKFNEHVIDMDQYIDFDKYYIQHENLEFDNKLKAELVDRAIDRLKENKKLHDELEENYVPYIKFHELTEAFEAILP